MALKAAAVVVAAHAAGVASGAVGVVEHLDLGVKECAAQGEGDLLVACVTAVFKSEENNIKNV